MAVVNIPDPCSRKPESMELVNGGYYCDDCCKVVIDFRDKTNDEILNTLRNKSKDRICGFFTKAQATRGGKPTFGLARFAAALLLVFGSVLFVTSTTGCGGMPQEPSVMDSILAAEQDAIMDSARSADYAHEDSLSQKKIDSFNLTNKDSVDPVQWKVDSAMVAEILATRIDRNRAPKK